MLIAELNLLHDVVAGLDLKRPNGNLNRVAQEVTAARGNKRDRVEATAGVRG